MSKSVILDVRELKNFRGRLPREVSEAALETARAIQHDAKSRVPVDTGSLSASIYISSKSFNDYDKAEAAAQAAFQESKEYGITPKGRHIAAAQRFRMSALEIPTTNRQVLIVAGASHAALVESGTSRMSPQPFLQPALDNGKELFISNLKSAVEAASGRLATRRSS